ncbi:dnaJ homolog subfamily C member 7-like [Pocillopora damicornis]|uniref:dnaJ homolog subfamily C member 7-like n=1 Tax=Pocillopora damicornis TaxID=46731 RepID=UPI000F5513A2|nr:dnaJ homolog subfamily C member 7-like [Pocillopora damicornis]
MSQENMADVEMNTSDGETSPEKQETDEQMDVTEEPELDNFAKADAKKQEGNREYIQKNYEAAVKLYTEAIELAPTVVTYYGNRSAAYMMIGNYDKALEDAQTAIKTDENFMKGYFRAAKCHLVMGSIGNAINYLQKVLEKDPKNKDAQDDLRTATRAQDYESSAFKAHDEEDYRKVIYYLNHILESCPACALYKVMRAEAYCLMGKYSDALRDVQNILIDDSLNSDALYVKGLCLYYQDYVDKAFQHFSQVLRRDPDHKKARLALKKAKHLQSKKNEGNEAFTRGKYQLAYDTYTEALTIDPRNKSTNAKLCYNRALVCSKLNQTEKAIEDCSQAVELDSTYLKAYIKRARCDIFHAYAISGVQDGKPILQTQKPFALFFSSSDRHSGATEEVKKSEELLFKEVNEAYSVLSDPKKKARYDSGQDLEDGMMMSDIDPRDIFQAFFGGHGGFGGFNFGGPGGGGFPGGVQFTFG